MRNTSISEFFLLNCFQRSLAGRLGHGIVHNLNGPLQILSMQLEMLKMDMMKLRGGSHPGECGKTVGMMEGRLEQIGEVIVRLDSMIQLLGYRGADESAERQLMPVDMCRFIRDLIEFWNADLYFKHRVAKEIVLPDSPIFQVMDEFMVIAMMDGIMAGFIYCIKQREDGGFGISLEPYGDNGCMIRLEHSGRPMSDALCSQIVNMRQQYQKDRDSLMLESDELDREPELFLAMALGACRSVELGWEFSIAPLEVVLKSPGDSGALD